MFFQTLYFLIDLYFVAGLGPAAIAGVGAAGNVMFIVFAVTQVLGVGTVALISHAVGRKDQADATLIFNQSLVLSASFALITLVIGYSVGHSYVRTLGSDAATVLAGTRYLYWFLPSLALQFALVVMGSALRGTGIVQPTMIVQVATVILNAVLAPVLIAGWGTGRPMGVAGAGWGRLLRIGLPAGGEFALMFVYMAVIYWIIRRFGADAQAGFGIGQRITQSMFLPAMAVAFATAPIVGQNFAAGKFARVRETFVLATLIGSCIMVALTLFCQWRSAWAIHAFTADPAALASATLQAALGLWLVRGEFRRRVPVAAASRA
jgi:Na+-driven multidrug efflux pump